MTTLVKNITGAELKLYQYHNNTRIYTSIPNSDTVSININTHVIPDDCFMMTYYGTRYICKLDAKLFNEIVFPGLVSINGSVPTFHSVCSSLDDISNILFTVNGRTMYYDGLIESQNWTMNTNGFKIEFVETSEVPKTIKFINDWDEPVHVEVVRSDAWNLSRGVDPMTSVEIPEDAQKVIVEFECIDKMIFTRTLDGWDVRTPKGYQNTYTCDVDQIRLHDYYDPDIFMHTLFASGNDREVRTRVINTFKKVTHVSHNSFWIKTTHPAIIKQIVELIEQPHVVVVDYNDCVRQEDLLLRSTRVIIERVVARVNPNHSVLFLHNIDADYDIETNYEPWMDDALKDQGFVGRLRDYLSCD